MIIQTYKVSFMYNKQPDYAYTEAMTADHAAENIRKRFRSGQVRIIKAAPVVNLKNKYFTGDHYSV